MIKSVTLHNFRKHTFLEVNFEDGLNVIRAPSEGGKTTVLEAISYALWGSKALRTSLEDAVTYGQPMSTIKVSLVFNLDGVSYTITRGKSGAEIIYSDQSVTGQTECTKFMERLFRCSADIASKLLFADQNAVRGILSEGATAADGLVNTLSELNTIESLISKVQDQLPSGNVGAIESQIKLLQDSKLEMPTKPSESELVAAKEEFSAFSEKIDLLEQAVPDEREVVEGLGRVENFNAAQARISKIMPFLEGSVTPSSYTEEKLAELRASQAGAPEQARLSRIYTTPFPSTEYEWEGSRESFDKALADNTFAIAVSEKHIIALNKEIHTATILKVNEKSCSFCKKDLTDVPEVALLNAAADEKIKGLNAELASTRLGLQDLQATQNAYIEIDGICHLVKQIAGEHFSLSDDVPPKPTWIGAIPVKPSHQADLAPLEKELRVYQAEMTKREVLEAELAELSVIVVAGVDGEKALVEKQRLAKEAVEAAKPEQGVLALTVREAKIHYSSAVAAYELALAQLVVQATQLQGLKDTQGLMLKHNSLVKKLRVIRPQIAAQLWGSVLAATSQYFSMIRGTSSTVSRDAKGFKVDGRGIRGLSGSTLDALGLAIRMSLSKLFLPGVPLLVLDEAFAGAEPTRELAGISTIASAGFSQVLFITHSDAPESIADNLIEL